MRLKVIYYSILFHAFREPDCQIISQVLLNNLSDVIHYLCTTYCFIKLLFYLLFIFHVSIEKRSKKMTRCVSIFFLVFYYFLCKQTGPYNSWVTLQSELCFKVWILSNYWVKCNYCSQLVIYLLCTKAHFGLFINLTMLYC